MESAAMEMRPPSSTLRLSTKPSSSAPEQLRFRQPAVLEDHLAGGAGAQSQLVFLLPQAEAGRVLFDDEGRDAVLRGGAVGHRHGHADIREMGVGGEGLGAVEHPAAILSHGRGAGAGGVRTGLRLGERPAADPFPGSQLRNIAAALLLAAHLVNVVGAQRIVRGHDDAHRAIHAREFLDDDGVLDVAQAGAAQLLGKNRPHVAQPAQLADHFEREDLPLIPLRDVRRDFRFREFPDGLAELDLFRSVLEFHFC